MKHFSAVPKTSTFNPNPTIGDEYGYHEFLSS
jgi:hypothetical protein